MKHPSLVPLARAGGGSRRPRPAALLAALGAVSLAAVAPALEETAGPEPPIPEARRPRPLPGNLTHVPSAAGGQEGIAVRVVPPRTPRYTAGAPVAVHVPGGLGAGAAAGRPELAALGFVEVSFAFPSGGRGEARSGGSYDLRGPRSLRALADVIRFALGRAEDLEGRKIGALLGDIQPLARNCGLIGWSLGGNTCSAVLARHGGELPGLAFYVSMESPYGEGAVSVELGDAGSGVNPAYDARRGVLDLSRLAWSPDLAPAWFRRREQLPALRGALFFDLDGDGRFARRKDFPAHVLLCDAGEGLKAYYTPRLLREAEHRSLFGEGRPRHIPALREAEAFWHLRDGTTGILEAVRHVPELAVLVYAGERDHVQAAPDHPHILAQVEGFRRAGARFVRLNPDRAYVERLVAARRAAPEVPQTARAFCDNDAGRSWDRETIREGLEPRGPPPRVYVLAAACELADRVQAGEWSANLERILYPDAPWAPPAGPREDRRGAARPPRPERPK